MIEMTPLVAFIWAVVLIACGLLIFNVLQALTANRLLADIMSGPSAMIESTTTPENDRVVERTVRSYSLVADPAAVSNRQKEEPITASDYVPLNCNDNDEEIVYRLGTYAPQDLSWMILRRSDDSARLWTDITAGKVRYMLVSGVLVRVWAAPSVAKNRAASSTASNIALIVAKYGAAKVDADADSECQAVPVVPPLAHLTGSWSNLAAMLNSNSDPALVPLHVWAF